MVEEFVNLRSKLDTEPEKSFDSTFFFGPHCSSLREEIRPLRKNMRG